MNLTTLMKKLFYIVTISSLILHMKYFVVSAMVILCAIISHNSQAQTVENIVLEFDGNQMSISYDLTYASADQKFNIALYSSHNNYQKPITLVTGAVGDNILPGLRKTVTWDLKNELPATFNDEIDIKVKATMMATNYSFNAMAKAFKRGTNLQLTWEGGLPDDRIKIDLMKDGMYQQTITQTNNTKGHSWNIPKHFDKGAGYTLRLSNIADSKQKAISSTFAIKSRIPLLLKIAPVVLVAVLVGVLSGGGGSEPGTGSELSELPGPISPSGG
jgi:hypothetical protein